MGSPAGCGCHFRHLHLNYDREDPAPGKHCGDASLAQRCQLHKRHNACEPLLRRTSNAMGQQRHDLRDYKEAKTALLRSVANVWRSIPVLRRMEKDL